jgi:hypothetical protein
MKDKIGEDAEAVRRRLLDQRSTPTLNPSIIEQAKTMGRQGVLQSMVLYDINKKEALDMAKRNLLEYRTDGPLLGKRETPEKSTDDTSLDVEIRGLDTIRRVDNYAEVK